MPVREEYEVEINLKDLFFHLLYRWRSILLVALAAMLALGFWQNYKVDSVHAKGEKTEEEEAWELEVKNYHEAIDNNQRIIENRNQQIEQTNEYLTNSIWANLDSENELLGTRSWFVQSTQEVLDALPQGSQIDPADYAINSYLSTVRANLDAEDLRNLFGTDKAEYIDEVFSIYGNTGSNSITVSISSDSEEKVKAVLDFFEKRLDEVSEPQAQAISAHTRIRMSEDVKRNTTTKAGTNVERLTRAAEKKNRQENIIKMQEEITKAQTELNKLLRKKEPSAPGKHLVRYAAIGLIAGAAVMMLLYAALYVLRGRIHEGSELQYMLPAPLYGSQAHSRARRPGKGIDGLIEKWEFLHTERDPEKVYDNIGALVKENISARKLLLTGSVAAEKLEAVRARLAGRLPEKELITAPELPRSAEAVARLSDAEAILVVEEKEVSRRADVRREAELLRIGEKKADGCIML